MIMLSNTQAPVQVKCVRFADRAGRIEVDVDGDHFRGTDAPLMRMVNFFVMVESAGMRVIAMRLPDEGDGLGETCAFGVRPHPERASLPSWPFRFDAENALVIDAPAEAVVTAR